MSFIDRQIDDFVIRERIGQGGMATVYRAEQLSVNRDVALKIIQLQDTDPYDTRFQRRFTNEAEVIARLEHIHILPVYGYGVTDEIAYLAMRLLRGGTLRDLISQPLPIDQAADLFRQVARGLAYAHTKGVIHRDLKPSNIMLDDAGNAFLADFGLAKLIGGAPQDLTKTGTIAGTPAYMSPEQLRGEAVDHRSDIYSLGVVLYHMLAGRPPFGGPDSDLVSTIYQHLEQAPTPPSAINPQITPEVEAVILRALRKRRDERYESAELMADALFVALGRRISSSGYPALQLPETRDHRTALMPHAKRRRQLKRGLATALITGLLVIAVAIGLLLTLDGGDDAHSTAPIATVIVGEEAPADDAVPTDQEIARAQARLGTEGFIAYITCTQNSEYHATQAREMGDFAAQYGLEYRIYDSDTDKYEQLTLIEKARADGASGLIICPLDPDLISGALTSVQRARLPLVFMHSDIPSYGGVLLAGDDYLMGLEAGRFAGQIIAAEMGGQADVIILDYPELPILVIRANGLEDGILEYAPEANIIGRYRGGTRDFGYESVSRLIAEGVTFDVIASINDAGSLGAITAMEEAGFAPDSVIVSSVDAEALALEYIEQGYFMRGSVAVGREQFSHTAIDALVKLLAGSTLPETFIVPPGTVVTQSTLRTVKED